jgi:hypothetical protein
MTILRANRLLSLVSIGCAIVAIIAISLLVSGREPAFGQIGVGRIPNMVGTWRGEIAGYFVQHTAEFPPNTHEAVYFEDSVEMMFVITKQNGRAFGGNNLTGVILPDGTVAIQAFEPTELRMFLTGSLQASGRRLEINGYGHLFDDFGITPVPPDHPASEVNDGMGTFMGRFFKVQ